VTDHQLRAPCACGSTTGVIRTVGLQDTVRCACGKFQYNAPRTETGRKQRTLASREGITPSMRARILDRHDHACIACGKRPPEVRLELEHMISREVAAEFDLLDDLIDSEWNLAPMCAECNSGHRWLKRPAVRLMYRCLMMAQRAAGDRQE
jgi:5-methylcytosine-specific restriction endonuclease McrA